MSKYLVSTTIRSDFPEYKILSIEEFGFPIFKKEVVCLITISKGLPIILDFTLKLLNLKVKPDTIPNLLGIDDELIKHAIYDLDSKGMIKLETLELTDIGKKYIFINRYEDMKSINLPVCIDGYTAHSYSDSSYISGKQVKAINLNTVRPLIDKKDNGNISGQVIKTILKNYLQQENEEVFEGDLIEIVKVNDRPNEYRRLWLAVLETSESQLRYVVYDKNIKIDRMEALIHEADEAGIVFYKYVSEEAIGSLIEESVLPSNYNSSLKDYLEILDIKNFNNDYSTIYFSIPFVEIYNINDEWINALESYLNRKLKVSLYFTGYFYPSEYYKNQILKIIALVNKFKKYLKIYHSTRYEYASVFFGESTGYLDKISKYDLDLKNSAYCIKHDILELSNRPFLLPNTNLEIKDFKTNADLLSCIVEIIKRSKDLDIQMEEVYGYNWLKGGQILNENELTTVELSSNSMKFSDFTKKFNSSFVEVITKVGKEQGLNKYLFNDFKRCYPELFDALNRLRVYRNSTQHNDLDKSNLEAYKLYIERDLKGQFPEFTERGYLYLQKIIVDEILTAIKVTAERLSSI